GNNDIQVSVAEVEKLAMAQMKAKKVIIPGMTHTLKITLSKETQDNLKTYTDPTLPISKDLVSAITLFIKK
ncbi:MAG TPA: alpha/beta hydrolase, partial [Flavisolibacter sp.]|nr:alpha/beta hydrolase [Flavisolibacter sp.]